ncbi:MAG: hypothetical protein ACTSPY_17880 [Candidatus Helarchaeota archaeon]
MADPTENLPIKQRVIIQEKLINDQKEFISSLKTSMQNLEELIKKEQSLNEEKQKIIAQQQDTISEQQSTITEQDSIIRDQQISIVSQQKDLSTLSQEIKEKTEQLLRINTEWENQASLLKNRIFDMKNELSEKEKKFENTIAEREEKIRELTNIIKNLEIELESIKTQQSGGISKSAIKEYEDKIKELEKTIFEKDKTIKDLEDQLAGGDLDLKTELEIKNIKIAELERRLQALSGEGMEAPPPGERSNIILTKTSAIESIKSLIGTLKSTGMIFVPTIDYLEEFDLDQLKSSVRLKIATYIDYTNQQHVDLFNKYNSMNNIEIKIYEAKDLWAINKDLEILLFAPIGENKSIAGLIVHSENQIDFFASLLNSSWTARCKQVRI